MRDTPRRSYWMDWYASGQAPGGPSDFSKWVRCRMPNSIKTIVDAGAGNLRDSTYFLSLGHTVTAVDWSTNLDVLDYDYSNADMVYSRWLIHAMDESEESRFLELASRAKWLMLECRSANDHVKPRLSGHYRRPVDLVSLYNKVQRLMDIQYCRASRGWSVDGMDDPELIRLIAKRR